MNVTPEDVRSHLAAHPGKTASLREIIRHFEIPQSDRPAFRRMLKDLAREGFLVRVRGGRYAAPESLALTEGTIQAHPDGYAFLLPAERGRGEAGAEEGPGRREPDVFIPPRGRGGALHGDRVLVRTKRGFRGKLEGEVVQVLERGAAEVVGRIEVREGRRWFVPLDRRFGETMEIERGGEGADARKGMIAVLGITRYPSGRVPARGNILRALGYPEDPQVEVDMICAEFGIVTKFAEAALREAAALSEPGAGDSQGREDLTGLLTFTIDGESAWDFDDAVSLEASSGGARRLGVHIADVSHYVTEESALDEEARLRGTSVYFPGRAIPMLPPALSENICSLVPGRERLTLSAFLDYDAEGDQAQAVRFAETVIRSRARLTYAGVTSFLEGTPAEPVLSGAPAPEFSGRGQAPGVTPPGRYAEIPGLEETLRAMARLARQLRERRFTEGGLDFDIPEAEVLLDGRGRVAAIRRAPRTVSNQIIEDFMLAANRAVARRLTEEDEPGIFRVHEPPDPHRLEEAARLLRNLRYRVPDLQTGTPDALRLALEGSRGEAEETLVNMALLRAMKLARYDSANLGHFGLGFTHYTHFTSPIRRYPDLLVHRLLRAYGLAGRRRLGRRRMQSLGDRMQALAEDASRRERAAESAERAMMDYKRAQFMKDRVGETFEGKVSGIVATGFFVTLDEHFVDGFVRLAGLTDDYYVFDEDNYQLIGRRTKRIFRLGDAVTIRVDRADLDARRLDFSLVEPLRPGASGGRRPAKTREVSSRAALVPTAEKRKRSPRERPHPPRRTGLRKQRPGAGRAGKRGRRR